MGSAALDALLMAGVDALGFDPLDTGAARGSSHGSCRCSGVSILKAIIIPI
jgi:sarcosine oxidase